MEDVNKLTGGDYSYAVTKAGLGSIPILGAAASELFGLIITPPLERRRQKWIEEISIRLKELEEKNKLVLVDLAKNEFFIDTVLVATGLAIKTSESQKIKAFQNAIINTAIGEFSYKTKCQIFLNFLDSFTVWHIKILHFINNPIEWFKSSELDPPNANMGTLSGILKIAFPELEGQDELVDVIWRELYNYGLHRTSELKTMMSGNGLLTNRTSELGSDFLKYISENKF